MLTAAKFHFFFSEYFYVLAGFKMTRPSDVLVVRTDDATSVLSCIFSFLPAMGSFIRETLLISEVTVEVSAGRQ